MAVFRWLLEWIRDDKKVQGSNTDALWDKFNELRMELTHLQSEFAAHKGAADNEKLWLKEALDRLERKVDNVQAQIRNVATNSNDKTFKGKSND